MEIPQKEIRYYDPRKGCDMVVNLSPGVTHPDLLVANLKAQGMLDIRVVDAPPLRTHWMDSPQWQRVVDWLYNWVPVALVVGLLVLVFVALMNLKGLW